MIDTRMQAGRPDLGATIRHVRGIAPRVWTDQPLFADISGWQGLTDFTAPAMASALAIGIRIGVGLTYDANWKYNWEQARAHGKLRLPYWALTMHQSVRDQADMFHQAIKGEQELPAVWDCERVDGQNKTVITTQVQAALTTSKMAFKKPSIMYSAKWWLDAHLDPVMFYLKDEVWYWMAGYLYPGLDGYAAEHPGPVAIPTWMKWERVLIHQTAGKGMGKLGGWGVESLNIDLNRWIFGAAHLRQFAGAPPVYTLEEKFNHLVGWAIGQGYDPL